MLQKHAYMHVYFFFFLLLFTQGSISIYLTPCLAKQRMREEKERERRALFLSGAWFAKEKGNKKNTHMDSLIFSLISFQFRRKDKCGPMENKSLHFSFPQIISPTKQRFYFIHLAFYLPFLPFPPSSPKPNIVLTIYTIKLHPTLQDQMQCPPPPHPKKNTPNIYTHTKGINSY